MMKSCYAFLFTLLLSYAAQALEAVPSVDLSRYLGTWYEIAKYPNYFQEGCVASKADYSIWEEGVIKVNNRCLESDGKISQAIGKAYIQDPSHAKLKVQFFLKFINLSFLQGDYWIIKLDDNYQYAIVSEPSQEYLWILSRTPSMDDTTYQAILTWLEGEGFDLHRIVRDEFPVNPAPSAW